MLQHHVAGRAQVVACVGALIVLLAFAPPTRTRTGCDKDDDGKDQFAKQAAATAAKAKESLEHSVGCELDDQRCLARKAQQLAQSVEKAVELRINSTVSKTHAFGCRWGDTDCLRHTFERSSTAVQQKLSESIQTARYDFEDRTGCAISSSDACLIALARNATDTAARSIGDAVGCPEADASCLLRRATELAAAIAIIGATATLVSGATQ